MNDLKSLIMSDYKRYNENYSKIKIIMFFIKSPGFRFSTLQRIGYSLFMKNRKIMYTIVDLFLKSIFINRMSEISIRTEIGKGLYLGHFSSIIINPEVKIGKNVNIHKGVTIGQTNRGNRKGVPEIGDNVWIGINSTIVGNIKIGSNVLIAPNSYVNVDVPANSIVFGNPAIIKRSENATENYLNRTV